MDDQILSQIAGAVNAILDPETSHNERTAAHSICESCKENEMSCLIGFALASKRDMAPHIKQFGLQLMQNFVKNRWVNAPQEVQIQAKNNAVSLIETCAAIECSYVKDGIARVLAEIIKHVWPQQWPTMVQELIATAKKGAVQTELVELVFLRIAEDVAVLQNISASHRSQDIRQGLSLSMGELMEFFMTVLESNSAKYESLLGTVNASELEELKTYHSLCVTTLKTLQGFLEWASTEHLFTGDGLRVQLLCKLLEVQGLKVLSAECLIAAVHKKGQTSDRERIIVLTTPVYLNAMRSAAVRSPATDEEQYLFLKRMGDLLSSLSSHVVAGWSSEDRSVENEGAISDLNHLTDFLEILLDFLRNSNPIITDTVTGAWNLMLQHTGMIKSKLHQYVPTVMQIVASLVENCSNIELPVCSQLEFNDTEEIQLFLVSHRKNLLQIIRSCSCALPNECIRLTCDWLRAALNSKIDPGRDENGIKQEYCNYKSPSYIQWDTIKSIADVTIKTGVLYAKRQGIISLAPAAATEALLKDILSYETSDVLLLHCIIGFISAFLPMSEVLGDKRQTVLWIIQTYAKMLRYSVTHPDTKLPLVYLFRRHVLSAIVHLSKYYPSFVVLAFDEFRRALGELVSIVGDLEKISICEALVLVSGEWNDYSRQSELIREAMSFSTNMWIPEDDTAIQTPRNFAEAIGLCSPGDSYFADKVSTFRGNISFCVSLTLAMINRSRVPDDPENQRNGGFLDPDGNLLHPCAKHVIVVMEHIATLVKNFHALWTAPIKSIIHKDYLKSLDIRESERKAMVSFHPVVSKDPEDAVEKSPWERMQTFILIVLENCYQILGGVGKCCNVQLYGNPQLFPVFLNKAFSDISTLPQLRIRSFTRQFLYYFLQSCPEQYHQSVAAEILQKYCAFMNQVLQTQWNEFAAKEQARLKLIDSIPDRPDHFDDLKEDDEILKEQLLRTVSREYLDILVNLCVNKRPRSKNAVEEEENANNNDSEMLEEAMPLQSAQSSSQLTPLGLSLMQSEIAEALLATALVSLSWHDTTTAFKGIRLLWPLLKHTCASSPFISDDAAKFIFESVLFGLQRQGQHDACAAQLTALGLFTYVSLRPTHDSLLEVLKGIPKINHNALAAFDKGYPKYSEKKRKANFKKLVSGIIEQHVGQRFKCGQEMRKLPKFFRGNKAKSLDFDAASLGLELFFTPDSSS